MPATQSSSRAYLLTLLTIVILWNQISCGVRQISVCTYNLWNVMFSWEIRLRHIASMARQAGCDVLVLQEVRLHGDRSGSQALFLQQLMPHFHWIAVRQADAAAKPPDSYWTGWEREGLAVLSKLPMGVIWVEHLSKSHGPDTNQRIALHVPIIVDSQTTVNVIAVHFSYHRQQQCQNAAEILKFIHRNKLSNAVIAGDFNTYPDFPDPVELFMDRTGQPASERNQCRKSIMSPLASAAQGFQDAWEAIHKDSSGFTFSNMPTPGLTSRPDRILTSNNLRLVQMSLHGDGTAYKSKHSVDIMLHRLHRVLRAARDSFSGYAGYPCLQDCGPRGSCRCGVCIERTDMGSCQLPSCEECSPHTFVLLLAFSSILSLLFVLAGIATVNILIVASHVDQSNAFFFLGCTCCLCNPRLVRQSTATARHCAGRFLRCLGVGKLPPVYLLLLSLIVVVLSLPVTFVVFKPTFDTVTGAMPEEYFPSDHMMLHAQLEIL